MQEFYCACRQGARKKGRQEVLRVGDQGQEPQSHSGNVCARTGVGRCFPRVPEDPAGQQHGRFRRHPCAGEQNFCNAPAACASACGSSSVSTCYHACWNADFACLHVLVLIWSLAYAATHTALHCAFRLHRQDRCSVVQAALQGRQNDELVSVDSGSQAHGDGSQPAVDAAGALPVPAHRRVSGQQSRAGGCCMTAHAEAIFFLCWRLCTYTCTSADFAAKWTLNDLECPRADKGRRAHLWIKCQLIAYLHSA